MARKKRKHTKNVNAVLTAKHAMANAKHANANKNHNIFKCPFLGHLLH